MYQYVNEPLTIMNDCVSVSVCVGIDLALTELFHHSSLHLTFIRQSFWFIPPSTEMTFRSGDHSAPFPTSPPRRVGGQGERG